MFVRPQHALSAPTAVSAFTYAVVPVQAGHDWQSPSAYADPAGHKHAPPVHTPSELAPQPMPATAGFAPPLTHVCAPVAHENTPIAHGSAGVQLPPAEQVTHDPAAHTRPTPQLVPLASEVAASLHTGAPVPQAIVPLRHGLLDGTQLAPATQSTHAPTPHTRPVPQLVPLAALDPVSTHTAAPVAQLVVPVWQALPDGTQLAPATQATQAPALHTRPVPHVVPLERLVPVSVHTADPVLQSVAPVWQGLLDGVQVEPAAQALQAPLLHTRPVPQLVPLATLVPFSAQVAPLDPQTTVPLRQGFVGAQVPPPTHASQVPPRHSPPLPQAVPSETLAPVSLQTGDPEPHASAPTWQVFAVGVQAAPVVQEAHVPIVQTWLMPHVRPQRPQWMASVARETHPPPQSVWPAVHVAVRLMLSTKRPPAEL